MNTEEKFTVPSTQFVENPDGYVLKASLPPADSDITHTCAVVSGKDGTVR